VTYDHLALSREDDRRRSFQLAWLSMQPFWSDLLLLLLVASVIISSPATKPHHPPPTTSPTRPTTMPDIKNHQKRKDGHLCCLEQGREQRLYDSRQRQREEQKNKESGSSEECCRIGSTQGCLRCLFHRLRRRVWMWRWS
jgi:hypothetical protein